MMLKTTKQFIKFTQNIPEGNIIMYTSNTRDKYVLINMASSTIEWVDAKVIPQLVEEKILFNQFCLFVDRLKLKEKEDATR